MHRDGLRRLEVLQRDVSRRLEELHRDGLRSLKTRYGVPIATWLVLQVKKSGDGKKRGARKHGNCKGICSCNL